MPQKENDVCQKTGFGLSTSPTAQDMWKCAGTRIPYSECSIAIALDALVKGTKLYFLTAVFSNVHFESHSIFMSLIQAHR